MFLSVIMSIYNPSEVEFKECLESLTNQTYNEFELIIVNDGGDKKIFDILATELSHFKLLSVYHLEQNKGLAYALNFAFEKSKGKYIARMDADDICIPVRFEEQINFLVNNNNIDLVGSWAQCFGASDKVVKSPSKFSYINIDIFFNPPVIHPSVMGKRKIFELKYNKEFLKAQDYELWCRALLNGFKISNINKILLKYRIRVNSNSSKEQLLFAAEVRKKYTENCTYLNKKDKFNLLNLSNRAIEQNYITVFSVANLFFSLNKRYNEPMYIFKLLFINYLKLLYKKLKKLCI
jgi:glycosyltransferase involved in cell wall biosynthesis